jgi:hypothetical protein
MTGGGAAGASKLGVVGVQVTQNPLAKTQSAILPLVPYLAPLRWMMGDYAVVLDQLLRFARRRILSTHYSVPFRALSYS